MGVRQSFEQFSRSQIAGGVVLLIATAVALILANSGASDLYKSILEKNVALDLTVLGVINEGLMTLFFLSVGMEIKQEFFGGSLSSFRQAMLPLIGALGGMILPAAIYLAFNAGTPLEQGWGIPMATDIAFALGVIALLGNTIPREVRIFVAALAVLDDIGAIIILAVFYSHELQSSALLWSALAIVILIAINRLRITSTYAYILPSIFLWYAMLHSGIHSTLAGVIIALALPTRPMNVLDKFVAFVIIPLFAFANAGVDLGGGAAMNLSLFWGISGGLVLGKTIGVWGACLAAVKLRVATLPENITPRNLFGAAIVCGIGFTMAIFIAQLALTSESDLRTAKIAILSASAVAGGVGFLVLRYFGRVKSLSS